MNLVLDAIHKSGTIPMEKIGFVVLVSKYNDKWVIVKLKESDTWEFPGGAIEKGETPIEAAKREIGKIDFTDSFPYDNTRYPNVQPDLFRYVEENYKSRILS